MVAVELERQRRIGLAEPTALSTIVSKTGWTSVGDWLITRRISLVAVCCSSASVMRCAG